MARRVILSDDLTGNESEDVETLTWMYEGKFYEIDLGEDSTKKFEQSIARFLKVSREISRLEAIRRVTPTSESTDTEKIREWAKSAGYEIGDRGRISDEIREAFKKHVESQMDSKGDSPTGVTTASNETGAGNAS